jgi:FeS assembly SUF system protein
MPLGLWNPKFKPAANPKRALDGAPIKPYINAQLKGFAMNIAADSTAPVEGAPLIKPSTTDHPLYDQVVEACRTVFDPEIPVNIFDLGLVYTIEINAENEVQVLMTLTAPGCPVAGEMPGWVADAIEPLAGVKHVNVGMTFDPPWGMEMMSDEARLELGFM